MRKINFGKFIFLLLLSASMLVACSTNSGDAEVKLTVITSLERIGQHEPLFGDPEAVIKAARNEYEAFQVVVGAIQKNVRVVNAEISDLTGDAGKIGRENITLYRPEYVRIIRSAPRAQVAPGLHTDPLVPFIDPYTGERIKPFRTYQEYWPGPQLTEGAETYPLPFEVWKGQNQPIWVDVYIPKNAAAGEYKGTFTITLEDYPTQWGEVPDTLVNKVLTIPVNLTVWDFTLPDSPTHRNHFGGVGSIPARYNVERDSDEFRELEMRYCRLFADHRINPPFPRSIMPGMNENGTLSIDAQSHEALKKFISDHNMRDFEIPRAPLAGTTNPHRALTPDEKEKMVNYYRDYYNYVKENGWDQGAYVYLYDEPNTPECYSRVLELAQQVRIGAPGLKTLVVEQPYSHDPGWPHMGPAIDIWCGLLSFIDRDSTNYAIARGDEVWSYTALCQRSPLYHPRYEEVRNYDPPYWQIDMLTTSFRTPTWINYQYGITGILYWSFTTRVRDSWHNPAFRIRFNGDGYFIYPGVPCGIEGPVASIRLKNIRESMEDYEYFHKLEQLAGRDAVLDIVSEVAPEWWSTSRDPKVILAAREKIAEAIVRHKGQN
jgi:hypothetical protein